MRILLSPCERKSGQKRVEPGLNRPGFDPLYGVHVKTVYMARLMYRSRYNALAL